MLSAIPHSGRENLAALTEEFMSLLPRVAPNYMSERPENIRFRMHPDLAEEHFPQWHEFGIITHTRKVLEAFRAETFPILEEAKLDTCSRDILQQTVGSHTKEHLFEVSIALHDIGKFARHFVQTKDALLVDYAGHEAESERIIRTDKTIQSIFDRWSISVPEREYVARVAGLHFELGKFRDEARRSPHGYSIRFAQSEEAKSIYRDIAASYPEYNFEIGLFFLVDTLGKVSTHVLARTDAEIAARKQEAERQLVDANLSTALLGAVLQLPVNVAVATEFLRNTSCLAAV